MDPCMVYSPTFTIKNQPNVGVYTIHGSYGFGSLGKTELCSPKNQPLNGVVDEYKLRLQSKGHIGHIGHVAGYHTRGICRKIQFLFRNFCEKIT